MEVEAVDDDDMEARDLRRHTTDLSGPGFGTVGAVNILPETELFAALRPSVSGMVSKDDGAGMDTDDDDCWGMIIDEAAGAVSAAMSLKVVAVADKVVQPSTVQRPMENPKPNLREHRKSNGGTMDHRPQRLRATPTKSTR